MGILAYESLDASVGGSIRGSDRGRYVGLEPNLTEWRRLGTRLNRFRDYVGADGCTVAWPSAFPTRLVRGEQRNGGLLTLDDGVVVELEIE